MELTKYKITTAKSPGYMMVVYQDGHFKSVLNEFNPPLSELQLNLILNRIPDNHTQLVPLITEKFEGRIFVEKVKAIGAEPDQPAPEYPTNEKIALFCELFEAYSGIKYKASASDAGKMKALAVTPDELRFVLEVYFKSDEWFLTPKSIANFIKKYNEVRVIAYSEPKKRVYPLPYDEAYFNRLGTNEKHEYWQYLRDNDYKFVESNGRRSGKWVKQYTINK